MTNRMHLGIALVTALSACGRTGYEVGAGTVDFDAAGVEAFGGAETTGLAVTSEGAGLAQVVGYGTRSARLPLGLINAAAVGYGERIYLAGGASDFGGTNCTDQIVAYDPAADFLTQVQTASHQFRGGAMVSPGDGYIYHFNGYCTSSEEENEAYRFVPGQAGLTWVGSLPVGNFWQTGGHLPVPGAGTGAGRALVTAGGYGSGPLQNIVQWLDPATGNNGVLTATLPSERCLMAGAVVGDVFYVLGGSGYVDCAPPASTTRPELLSDIFAIELDPERVELIGSLDAFGPSAAACAVARDDGTLIVFGGLRYTTTDDVNYTLGPTDEVFIVDPSVSPPSVTCANMNLPEPRYGMACGRTADGRIFLAGGVGTDGLARDDILLVQPYEGTGTLLGPVTDAGVRATWTALDWTASVPLGATLTMELRIDDDETFGGGEDGWEAVESGALPTTLPRGRYAQWRALLSSTNGWASPVITGLTLAFDSE